MLVNCFFFFQAEDGIRDVAVTGVQTCALPIWLVKTCSQNPASIGTFGRFAAYSRSTSTRTPGKRSPTDFSASSMSDRFPRSEEHTSELQSRLHLVCRLLLEKKKKTNNM